MTNIIVFAGISGLANAFVLSTINSAADHVRTGEFHLRPLLIFGVAMALFLTTKRFILNRSAIMVEEVIAKLRLRIINKIRSSELMQLENIGQAPILNILTQETALISQTASLIINAFQGIFMATASVIYIATLSLPAFAFIVGGLVLGSMIYLRTQKGINVEMQMATAEETRFIATLNDILLGFKEIKLNQQKNDAIYEHIEGVTHRAKKLKTSFGLKFAVNFVFAQIVFYSLIASIVFLLPLVSEAIPEKITHITAAVLFLSGPLEASISTIPFFTRANIAIDNIYQLENAIEGMVASIEERDQVPAFTEFEKIEAEDLYFAYSDSPSSFSIGPISMDVRQGEILFVIGGNGSGKSTFLKCLIGLYPIKSGQLVLDGDLPITDKNIHAYRELFSAVFTDFHLFQAMFGMDEKITPDLVDEYLELMEMSAKVSFNEGGFSTLNLSTGQRKRLAVITAMLEDKPVMIFDEVAADQDPHFRKKFYTEILPWLKSKGKTIIMVTHDDKYFDQCDRILKMDTGGFVDNFTL